MTDGSVVVSADSNRLELGNSLLYQPNTISVSQTIPATAVIVLFQPITINAGVTLTFVAGAKLFGTNIIMSSAG